MPWDKTTASGEMTEHDWAYLAGIIDGEGSLGVYGRSPHNFGSRQLLGSVSFRIRLTITNTNTELIAWLCNKLGGTFLARKLVKNHKQCYVWNIGESEQLKRICREVYPYLLVKKRQAALVLQYPSNVKANQYTQKLCLVTRKKKLALYESTLILNKRGA